jgi:hypothetical protein
MRKTLEKNATTSVSLILPQTCFAHLAEAHSGKIIIIKKKAPINGEGVTDEKAKPQWASNNQRTNEMNAINAGNDYQSSAFSHASDLLNQFEDKHVDGIETVRHFKFDRRS